MSIIQKITNNYVRPGLIKIIVFLKYEIVDLVLNQIYTIFYSLFWECLCFFAAFAIIIIIGYYNLYIDYMLHPHNILNLTNILNGSTSQKKNILFLGFTLNNSYI